MDKESIKFLLSAMRPSGADADDPVFAEALREAQRDPELAKWLAEEQAFDAAIVSACKELRAPSELEQQLLVNAKTPRRAPPRAAWQWATAIAALFVLCLTIWQLHLRNRPGQDLALTAIDYTASMPKLQFVCFNADQVARWINEQPRTRQLGFEVTKPMATMRMIGSSTFEWNGKPVVMIALQNDKAMAMLYVVRSADFEVNDTQPRIMEKGGWVSKTATVGNAAYVITTRGSERDLRFDMPF